jgi:protein gp37
MADSKIEWTESVWNPVVGCSKVSQGCKHCYAERMAKRLVAIARAARDRGDNPGRAANYENVLTNKARWNGNIYLDREALLEPYKWSQPRVIFVNSMSDLFHENVPLEFIRDMFKVMNECQRHTFQILTKRPERAAAFSEYLKWTPNIWIGTSIENNAVIERIDHLRKVGGYVRFLSCEPLLESLPSLNLTGIGWVIVGGESGPGARPIEADWVREIQEQCRTAGVPFFFKQWGGVNKKKAGRVLDGQLFNQMPLVTH